MTLPRRFFDEETSEARSTSTLSAAGERQPMASSAKICADPLDRRVASVQGVHRPGHLLQLALPGRPLLAVTATSSIQSAGVGCERRSGRVKRR
jgi:hypothetical protein